MREKYIEERFPRYFVFGENVGTGLVDVADTLIDPIVSVTEEQAKVLIKERDKVIDMLVKVSQALNKADPKAFVKIWYEGESCL